MNIILILSSIINLIIKINTLNFPFCFEYGCEECTDNQYGSCTKCKKNFKLIDGKCPCFDSNCLIFLFFSKNEISEIFVKLTNKISKLYNLDIIVKSLIFLQ
jgi:hypothetical protein